MPFFKSARAASRWITTQKSPWPRAARDKQMEGPTERVWLLLLMAVSVAQAWCPRTACRAGMQSTGLRAERLLLEAVALEAAPEKESLVSVPLPLR